MKVEFDEVKPVELKYPILAKNVLRGFVVMFTAATKGLVLFDPNEVWGVGYFESDWIKITDREYWKILEKGNKITFTQE